MRKNSSTPSLFAFDSASEPYVAAPLSTRPSSYGIPEIKLSYVGDRTKNEKVLSSSTSAKLLRASFLPGEIGFQEFFKALYLDQSGKALGIHTIGIGGIGKCLVDMKVLFSGALLAHASSIIICHNHPSGNTNPSSEDNILTERIKQGAKLLDIRLLDHIVITEDSYYSYLDECRL